MQDCMSKLLRSLTAVRTPWTFFLLLRDRWCRVLSEVYVRSRTSELLKAQPLQLFVFDLLVNHEGRRN